MIPLVGPWSDHVFNDRLLRESRMRPITCMIREHQIRLYGHVARFPASDPAGQILNVFGTGSLRRILGYHWSDHVSNERLLRENRMRPVICMIHERQMRLCSHVARFPASDPAGRILSAREPAGIGLARWGVHYDTWLRQMNRHFAGGGGWAVWRPGGWPSGHRRNTAGR